MAHEENKRITQPEVWMRGPVAGVPDLLQPVAHTLLQAAEEIEWMMNDFPDKLLWERPAGVASVAFHLQHIPGVLDRLFGYAEEKQLSNEQLKYLSEEGLEKGNITAQQLVRDVIAGIQRAVDRLRKVDPDTLTNARVVGRKKLPSTVMGLLFHAAEHTMRHTGQLLVTVRVINEK